MTIGINNARVAALTSRIYEQREWKCCCYRRPNGSTKPWIAHTAKAVATLMCLTLSYSLKNECPGSEKVLSILTPAAVQKFRPCSMAGCITYTIISEIRSHLQQHYHWFCKVTVTWMRNYPRSNSSQECYNVKKLSYFFTSTIGLQNVTMHIFCGLSPGFHIFTI